MTTHGPEYVAVSEGPHVQWDSTYRTLNRYSWQSLRRHSRYSCYSLRRHYRYSWLSLCCHYRYSWFSLCYHYRYSWLSLCCHYSYSRPSLCCHYWYSWLSLCCTTGTADSYCDAITGTATGTLKRFFWSKLRSVANLLNNDVVFQVRTILDGVLQVHTHGCCSSGTYSRIFRICL